MSEESDVKVTITIDEGETRPVVPTGEASTAKLALPVAGHAEGSPIDGGSARPMEDFEGADLGIAGGPPLAASVPRQTGAMDAGAAPDLWSDGHGDGPLPLGLSSD